MVFPFFRFFAKTMRYLYQFTQTQPIDLLMEKRIYTDDVKFVNFVTMKW